jgi:antirestriction protein
MMDTETTTDTPRIYVASLSDYNAGRLHGVWLDADQTPDELHDAIRAMLAESPESHVCQRCRKVASEHWTHNTPPTPSTDHAPWLSPAEEWAIHDHEGFAGISLSEYASMDDVSELANAITEHGPAYAAYVSLVGADYATPSGFEDAYMGEWDSERAYAEEYIESSGILAGVPESVSSYFDYDAYAHDLFMDLTAVPTPSYSVWVFVP